MGEGCGETKCPHRELKELSERGVWVKCPTGGLKPQLLSDKTRRDLYGDTVNDEDLNEIRIIPHEDRIIPMKIVSSP